MGQIFESLGLFLDKQNECYCYIDRPKCKNCAVLNKVRSDFSAGKKEWTTSGTCSHAKCLYRALQILRRKSIIPFCFRDGVDLSLLTAECEVKN